jgi:transposase
MDDHIVNHSRVYDRIEIRPGAGRRRRWTAEQKGAIVAASFAPGARASDVARRFDISPSHLFLWRRAAKLGQLVLPLSDDMTFAPVVMDTGPSSPAGVLEVEVAGAVVRVTAGTDLTLLSGVIRALKAAA